MTNITPDQFEDYIISLLGKYDNDVVQKTVKNKVEEISSEAKKVVKSYSKPKDQLYITGDYQKGWGTTFRRKKGLAQVKVWNKKKPTLVHLLEFGHGGPYPAKAYPHVSPTEIAYTKKLYDELRRELQ